MQIFYHAYMTYAKRPKANALGLLQEFVMENVSITYSDILPFDVLLCNILDAFLLTGNKT
jgi:hypothetical protein